MNDPKIIHKTAWAAFKANYYSKDGYIERKRYGDNLNANIMRLVKKSPQAYIIFDRLLYWFKYKSKIYKSIGELEKETGLSARSIRTGLAVIRELKCIKYYRNSYQGTMVYELDETQLLIDLETHKSTP